MTRGMARLGRGAVVAVALAFAGTANAQWINEFHYDNNSTDVGEFVEIAGPAGADLTGWSLVLYNGNGGTQYSTTDLSPAGVLADVGGCVGLYVVDYPSNGIQNGAPDGMALVDNTNTVVEFISYEGTFAATDGPAAGMNSVDIGVSESGTFVGGSLQLGGSGGAAADFTWQAEATATSGAVNNNQTFSACGATGACCAPDGTCTEGLPGDCSGTYQGDNTLCANVVCPVTIGACCDLFGACTDGLEEANCDGIYQGNTSLCANVDCLAAPANCPVAEPSTSTHYTTASGTFNATGYYAEGNGNGTYSEFSVATFQFGPAYFGGPVSDITRAQLTLTVDGRSFSSGTDVEFFFTTDALGAWTFNGVTTNGIDASQFTYAPVSLGSFTIAATTSGRSGENDTFTLDLSSVEADLINEINSASEFQIIIAAVNPSDAITYSGNNNSYNPGPPSLAISIPGCPVSGACCDPYGTCSEVPSVECAGDYQGDNTVCADVSCPRLIPTVSEWGLAIMSLIGLAVGTIMFGRQRRAVA